MHNQDPILDKTLLDNTNWRFFIVSLKKKKYEYASDSTSVISNVQNGGTEVELHHSCRRTNK